MIEMKELVQIARDREFSYKTTVGVRKFDDMIIINQELKQDFITTNKKIKLTKQEFDNIVKFVKNKFKDSR